MDELRIEVRTVTNRSGREPICTSECVELTVKELFVFDNESIQKIAGREAANLVARAQETEAHGKSVNEWGVEDALEQTLRDAHQSVLEQDVRDRITLLNEATAKLRRERGLET